MIRVKQLKVEVTKNSKEEIRRKIAQKLKIKVEDIEEFHLLKESIDARKKEEVHYVYEVDVKVKEEEKVWKRIHSPDVIPSKKEFYDSSSLVMGEKVLANRPIVVGSGPAGLFASLLLAERGFRPIIIERGEPMEKRIETVEKFWQEGILNPESNVSFGEGGAGTFSDGKLNTLAHDEKNRIRKIFETFVECGAPKEILYLQKPHIGTDLLRKVIVNLREKIISLGGEFHYNTCLTDLVIDKGCIKKIKTKEKEFSTDVLVLAIGHSARDTFHLLLEKGLVLQPKPFAVGVRVEHPQEMIDKNQYGKFSSLLPRASYKLTYTSSTKRGVYSFCMCPGGYVVNASSEEGGLVVNGMSNHDRASGMANSAIVMTVGPEDFGKEPLSGLMYQQQLEKCAYQKGKGKIPVQLWKDFKEGRISNHFQEVKPMTKGDYQFADLNEVLPEYVGSAIKEAIPYFDSKIKGFSRDDAVLFGIESRTSSPVRIERDEHLVSNIQGIYPCGEGSGYAGGITTAGMDGIKVAEQIIETYSNKML